MTDAQLFRENFWNWSLVFTQKITIQTQFSISPFSENSQFLKQPIFLGAYIVKLHSDQGPGHVQVKSIEDWK